MDWLAQASLDFVLCLVLGFSLLTLAVTYACWPAIKDEIRKGA